ncbi:MAG: DEAD/DEAH box helicase family protein [Dehalococcoidia bacterium]|nr:DEAD/DEAH box helicase family protein [Dehalococcoidia bacterium]
MPPLLTSYEFLIAYGPQHDRVNEFYVPALSRAVRYDRSAGFFSSSALAVAATGVARLIANDGRMRLLVGAQLVERDVKALQGGADLAAVVADRMTADLEQITDAIATERLAALAWMIRQGTLDVRVVLPKGPDGHPLAAGMCHDYYHPKTGIFTDLAGNQVVFTGSINESEQAWLHNYEMFSVYCSWRPGLQGHISTHVNHFEQLWNGREENWIALPVPEAVRQRLLRYCPPEAPIADPQEKPRHAPPDNAADTRGRLTADQRERLMFQFLRDAPHLPNGRLLGEVASTVRLWPHQARAVDRVVGTYPQRYLLCDEVGLGKTLEGGAIAKQLLLSGRVQRCLILAPKSVCRQWQEELYEKFLMNVPLYDGSGFRDYFKRELPFASENPWNAFPFIIASSQLAKRRERMAEVLQAEPWDLVLVDEAHHARRKDFLTERYRRNRLLSLLLGAPEDSHPEGLAHKTRGLLLLTATPMQVDPREIWDLLTVLGLGGRWGASDRNFTRFFQEIRDGADADWGFLLLMVRDYLQHGGAIDPVFARAAQERVGLVTWENIKALPQSDKPRAIIAQLDKPGQAVLLEFLRRHTPLTSYVIRNTRTLLREYERRGLLGTDHVPFRKPEQVWIPMSTEEYDLYDRIEEYISYFYKKYEAERRGLGFVMTVYRKRLTSSFYAITKSLERRLQFLRGDPDAGLLGGLTDEDVEDEDLDADVAEDLAQVERSVYKDEMRYVEDFLRELRPHDFDSKTERLLNDLATMLRKRETVIVFTLYADTMDYLRDKIRAVYGRAVACYSGRGGEVWDGEAWNRVSKETIKKEFKEERIKILLGTDALSEGLNLQWCGMMINYDMPWNPMRVEQRIGRIDRIGQRFREVWIRNYFYEDTVEANVYRALEGRIMWFESVVGDLQPILARVARTITSAALETGAARRDVLAREIEAIKHDVDQRATSELNLDQYVPGEVEQRPDTLSPVTQAGIEGTMLRSSTVKDRLQPHPSMAGAYHLWHEGGAVPVTFDPGLFDEKPETVRLLSYGEELFDSIIDAKAAPDESAFPPWITRLASSDPQLCCYYRTTECGVESILSLTALEAATAREGTPFDDARLAEATRAFDAEVEAIRKRETAVEEMRQRTEQAAVLEKARLLLLQATYVDLAMSAQRGLFDQGNLAGFTEDAVLNLRRHGYPFAPLIRLVGTEGIKPTPTDSDWTSIQDMSGAAMKRKWDALSESAGEMVRGIAPVQGAV